MTVRELIAALNAVPNKDAEVLYLESYDSEPELMYVSRAEYTEEPARLSVGGGPAERAGLVLTS